MVLVLLVTALAVGAALLTGGRWSALADLVDPPPGETRGLSGLLWLVAAAAGQLVGSLTSGTPYRVLLVVSAVCILVFLGRNLRRPGVALLGLGFGANTLVVALNGAMPVSPGALTRAGLTGFSPSPRHELAGQATHLPWLGDVVPVALPRLGQAVSPGDVLIAAGTALLLYSALGGTGRVRTASAPPWHAFDRS